MKLDNHTDIKLDEMQRHSSVRLLNNLLSNQFVLLAKTWNFHWNVKGPGFKAVHLFMEELYNELIEHIDDTAERVRALGGRPIGSLKGYLEHNTIKDFDEESDLPKMNGMLEILLQDNETLIREMRQLIEDEGSRIDDSGTSNLIEDLIEKKEKQAWMIRSHLE